MKIQIKYATGEKLPSGFPAYRKVRCDITLLTTAAHAIFTEHPEVKNVHIKRME